MNKIIHIIPDISLCFEVNHHKESRMDVRVINLTEELIICKIKSNVNCFLVNPKIFILNSEAETVIESKRISIFVVTLMKSGSEKISTEMEMDCNNSSKDAFLFESKILDHFNSNQIDLTTNDLSEIFRESTAIVFKSKLKIEYTLSDTEPVSPSKPSDYQKKYEELVKWGADIYAKNQALHKKVNELEQKSKSANTLIELGSKDFSGRLLENHYFSRKVLFLSLFIGLFCGAIASKCIH